MVNTFLAVAVVILAAATVILTTYAVRVRSAKHGRGLFRKWPIPEIRLHDFDTRFKPCALGPARSTEVAFVADYQVPVGTSDFETWILANFAKTAKTIFEFGTATGKTAYLLARNAPDDAKVVTLTLGPNQLDSYREASGDSSEALKLAIQESKYDAFYYGGTGEESKIKQLFGDSKVFDEQPYAEQCDLIFIDGSHAYSYVKSDTDKALRMIKPGGVILWHDYRGPRHTRDVFRALNELNQRLRLRRIKGTSLVAYRHPA